MLVFRCGTEGRVCLWASESAFSPPKLVSCAIFIGASRLLCLTSVLAILVGATNVPFVRCANEALGVASLHVELFLTLDEVLELACAALPEEEFTSDALSFLLFNRTDSVADFAVGVVLKMVALEEVVSVLLNEADEDFDVDTEQVWGVAIIFSALGAVSNLIDLTVVFGERFEVGDRFVIAGGAFNITPAGRLSDLLTFT